MKIILLLSTLFLIGSAATSVSAQQNGDRMMVQDPTIHEVEGASPAAYGDGNQMAVQNKTMTQNAGEETNLQIQTQDQQMLMDGSGDGSMGVNAKMGGVSQSVQNLLRMEGVAGGIGAKVSEIAQAQNMAQEKLASSLEMLQSRSGFMRSLLGPNYQALSDLKQQHEENQLRIQALQEVMTQTDNEGDLSELQLAVQTFVEQNTALQEQINAEEAHPGLFGWFFRLFNQ
jgi:hypothetical protein